MHNFPTMRFTKKLADIFPKSNYVVVKNYSVKITKGGLRCLGVTHLSLNKRPIELDSISLVMETNGGAGSRLNFNSSRHGLYGCYPDEMVRLYGEVGSATCCGETEDYEASFQIQASDGQNYAVCATWMKKWLPSVFSALVEEDYKEHVVTQGDKEKAYRPVARDCGPNMATVREFHEVDEHGEPLPAGKLRITESYQEIGRVLEAVSPEEGLQHIAKEAGLSMMRSLWAQGDHRPHSLTDNKSFEIDDTGSMVECAKPRTFEEFCAGQIAETARRNAVLAANRIRDEKLEAWLRGDSEMKVVNRDNSSIWEDA